jgi:hypothetical protein
LTSWLLVEPLVNLVLPKLPQTASLPRWQAMPFDPLVDGVPLNTQEGGHFVN